MFGEKLQNRIGADMHMPRCTHTDGKRVDLHHPRTQVIHDVRTNAVMPFCEAASNDEAEAAVDDETSGELTPPIIPEKILDNDCGAARLTLGSNQSKERVPRRLPTKNPSFKRKGAFFKNILLA